MPRPVPALLLTAALAAASALGGCAAVGGIDQPPRVSLVDIAPVDIQLLEQRFLATLRVQNPNDVELPIRGLEYKVTLNGRDFASGVSSQHVTVPAFGETTLEVGLNSTIVQLFEQLRGFGASGGVVRYAISGTVSIGGVVGGMPFSQEGEIDLSPTPREPGRTVGRAAPGPA